MCARTPRCITRCWRRAWMIRSGCARSAAERHARLVEILERDIGPTGSFDALAKRTLAVFDAITQCRHRYGAEAIGLYIVSGVSQADDVLAPLVLARWAGAYDKSKRRGGARRGAAVRPRRDAGALRRGDARAARGWRLQTSSGSPRATADCADRLFRQQPGERHGRLAPGGLPRAAPSDRRAATGATSSTCCSTAAAAAFRAAAAASTHCCVPHPPNRSTVCCTSPSRARASARTTVCGRTPCARWSALSARWRWRPWRSSAASRCARALRWLSASGWLRAAAPRCGAALIYEQPQFLDFFRAVTPIDVIERMQIGANPRAAQRARWSRRHTAGAVGAGLVAVAPHAPGLVWGRRRPGIRQGGARHRAATALLSGLAVLPQSDRRYRGHAGARRSGRGGAL